ncbi:hypothetical protein J7E93_11385 [Streptomyces sp. ISL-36]|uniref:hypothetical protein n=1 Tax=Streptomyces sp. ISL-36 TaxID=2819182 RepID=UPI001BE577DC|nr:hypothetical protein [Streptomyces sp. ISL-36]MBT2440699.1 hypothetical protein [Streptomyces sp. ISL-36]
MMVRTLFASAGVGAVLALGAMAAPAQAAPAASTPGQASVSDVVIMSCPPPPTSPAPRAGYRCLSSYSTEAQCNTGVQRHIAGTPATSGYCQRSGASWWGFVNKY